MSGKYRHELKFLCTAQQLERIRHRIRLLMRPDPHAGPDGSYIVTSVYFDSPAATEYLDIENGTDVREKLRLRCYDFNDTHVVLERKTKCKGLCQKSSVLLPRAQWGALLGGHPVFGAQAAGLTQYLGAKMLEGYAPGPVVEYRRQAYILRAGNVRVTLDMNITGSRRADNAFAAHKARRPVLGADMHLLEVKYDEFLPGFIRSALDTGQLQQTSFSKYYYAKRHTL